MPMRNHNPTYLALFNEAAAHAAGLADLELPPHELAGLMAAARLVDGRLREAGAEGLAAALAGASAEIAAAGDDAAGEAALGDWLALLAAHRPGLPAPLVFYGYLPLRRAVARIAEALGAPEAALGLGEALVALGRALPELPQAPLILPHLDHIAAHGGPGRAEMLEGILPTAPALTVATSLSHMASVLEAGRPAPPAPREAGEAGLQIGGFQAATGLASPYWQRVLHTHIMKCAGTSLNRWLDTLAGDQRSWDSLKQNTLLRTCPIFQAAAVLHGHRNLMAHAPRGTLRLAVLREPVARLVSQVSDWRRLDHNATRNAPAELREMVADTQRMPVQDFLARHRRGAYRHYVDNTMTRMLASSRLDKGFCETADPSLLLGAALACLEEDAEVVGLTEELDLTRNAIAERLGLPPVPVFPRLNDSASDRIRTAEGGPAAQELAALTRFDAQLHARAVEIFEARHRATAQAWTDEAFEARDAAATTSLLRGDFDGEAMCFSVRGPLIGRGFHPRDGAGTPFRSLWSGPGPRLLLYMPVPAGLPIELLVWVRGYADPSLRGRLEVRVDGAPAPHLSEPLRGHAERLVIPCRPSRPFVRLEIDTGETVTHLNDPRPRGIAFDTYGWRTA